MWMLTLKARPFYPLMFQWPTWESSTQSIAQARKNQHEKRWMRALNNGKALSNSNSLSSGKKKGTLTSIVLFILKGWWICERCCPSPQGEKPSCEAEAAPGPGCPSGEKFVRAAESRHSCSPTQTQLFVDFAVDTKAKRTDVLCVN